MKQLSLKQTLLVLAIACAVPATLLAQDENGDKIKGKDKPKKQQIVITRNGDDAKKTVIEIDGDKVRINGKDATDLKDVNVHVNNLKGSGAWGSGNNFDFDLNLDQPSLFSEDSNRAMLGVVTDGDDKGAEIQSITKGSAAEKAGLKKGDIITKIDNKKIVTTDEVTETVRSHKPGDKVAITYLRDDKEQKTTADLGRWKGMRMTTMVAPKVWTNEVFRDQLNNNLRGQINNEIFENNLRGYQFDYLGGRPRLGMSVEDTDDGKGVKVLEIEGDGSAAKAGVKEGDIITQVDDAAVKDADEIAKLMRDKRDQPFVKLQITRNGQPQSLSVRMKEPKKVDL